MTLHHTRPFEPYKGKGRSKEHAVGVVVLDVFSFCLWNSLQRCKAVSFESQVLLLLKALDLSFKPPCIHDLSELPLEAFAIYLKHGFAFFRESLPNSVQNQFQMDHLLFPQVIQRFLWLFNFSSSHPKRILPVLHRNLFQKPTGSLASGCCKFVQILILRNNSPETFLKRNFDEQLSEFSQR